MKRKLYITTTIASSVIHFFGGQIKYLGSEFDITAIASPDERLGKFGADEECHIHSIPMVRGISPFNDIVAFFRFVSFFVRNRPDIVHGNTPKASFLSMCAAWITRVRVRIYMCHGLRYQGCTGLKRNLLMNVERITCYCATTVICVSYGLQRQMISDRICPEKKLRIIRNGSVNGIDMSWYDREKFPPVQQLRRQFNLPEHGMVYLFVGRIVRDKGIEELVKAFSKLKKQYDDISLLLIGGYENLDPISAETEEIIDDDPSIRLVGKQPDVRPFYCCADALVLPSYREGFGLVLMEAGSMGLPCITTDICGCNEIIENGKNGIIVPKQNADALYEAMKYVYENPQKRAEMAAKARAMIASRYRQQDVWAATLAMYKSLG